MNESDLAALKQACARLENPSFAARVTDLLGAPVDKALTVLPDGWSNRVVSITEGALSRGLNFAASTLDAEESGGAADGMHKLLSTASGALGGAFGLPALAVELPITTIIMLRSIADIARSEGENIHDLETRLACLEVFALGGSTPGDDSTGSGYYAMRVALSSAVSEAVKHLMKRGVSDKAAPPLLRLITQIASRFSIQISQKAAAQAVPLVGAAGGATLNLIFMDHFQEMARGHFVVRRLERAYGPEVVRRAYQTLASESRAANTPDPLAITQKK